MSILSRVSWAAAAIGLLVWRTVEPRSATNYTITVDASMQTAGNPRFWAAASARARPA